MKDYSLKELRKISEAYEKLYESSDEDSEYLEAVKQGDVTKCFEMVRKAASKAMPNTKLVDSKGLPTIMYHGTSNFGFNSFEGNSGFWVTDDESYAEEYHDSKGFDKPGTYKVFVNMENPVFLGNLNAEFYDGDILPWSSQMGVSEKEFKEWLDSAGYDYEWSNIPCYEITSNPLFIEWLIVLGFDGIEAEERIDGSIDTVCVFSPCQLKSAEPVTYDDSGDVIPLSKRFDIGNNDIRY